MSRLVNYLLARFDFAFDFAFGAVSYSNKTPRSSLDVDCTRPARLSRILRRRPKGNVGPRDCHSPLCGNFQVTARVQISAMGGSQTLVDISGSRFERATLVLTRFSSRPSTGIAGDIAESPWTSG